MPRSARTVISSSSFMLSIRSPLTKMRPASGFSSPSISRRIVDFPAPLAPRKILVCPVCSVKLTLRRITFSSNAEVDLVEHDDRPAEGRGPRRAARERGDCSFIASQYIRTMRSLVTRKSTAMTATELATTAFVVARPTPCVPPRRPQADVAADARRS